jgi:hypothetical protein
VTLTEVMTVSCLPSELLITVCRASSNAASTDDDTFLAASSSARAVTARLMSSWAVFGSRTFGIRYSPLAIQGLRRDARTSAARLTNAMKYPARAIVFSSLALFCSSIEQESSVVSAKRPCIVSCMKGFGIGANRTLQIPVGLTNALACARIV